jgi:plastocyanin
MRKRALALAATAAACAATAAVAAPSAQARTFYLYHTSFSPSSVEEPSGVVVRFFNVDSVPHRIVSYQRYGARTWSLDVTIEPWQGYTVPTPFTCTASSCVEDLYPFRDFSGSTLSTGADGTVHCAGYCGELWVYR